MRLKMTMDEVAREIDRIVEFLKGRSAAGDRFALGVSGGLDSDVTARLAVRAFGPERIKLFTVIQKDMEGRHLENARKLSGSLNIPLREIDLSEIPFNFVKALAAADPEEKFDPAGLLDPSRAKCSIRTVILSSYQDRGYVILGTSNLTEKELGFFLPFGDNLAHLKPVAHLYKTHVIQLARALGTTPEVISQPPSAGFWKGQEDLEDIAYWICNEGPIGAEISFDGAARKRAAEIRTLLTTENVDAVLMSIAAGAGAEGAADESGLPVEICRGISKIVEKSKVFKNRELCVCIK